MQKFEARPGYLRSVVKPGDVFRAETSKINGYANQIAQEMAGDGSIELEQQAITVVRLSNRQRSYLETWRQDLALGYLDVMS